MKLPAPQHATDQTNTPSISTPHDIKSAAAWIASEGRDVQDAFLNGLSEAELLALPFLFEFWAMPHQLPPDGAAWRTWVIMGGRGAGKTRAGAEWVRAQVEGARPLDPGTCRRIALVGETIEQVREVMVFGESGLLACSPPDRRPEWQASRGRLIWPNGAVAQVFSAFDPERLRGPQFDGAWVDEMGCAAIDKGSNQPNKFLDPKSSESALPYHSNGFRDEVMQMQYLRAMFQYWEDDAANPVSSVYAGRMVDMSRAHVWAWDARPYPFFPGNSELWSDAANYAKGHWITGRASSRSLASVVAEICTRAGETHFDVSGLYGVVRGYSVGEVSAARAALQPLMLRFGFDAVERDGVLTFLMRDGREDGAAEVETLAVHEEIEGPVERLRASEADLVGRVRLRFVQADGSFEVLAEEAVLPDEATHAVATSEMPIALTRGEGRQVVERWLSEARVGRDTVRFALPPSRLDLAAGDVVALEDGARRDLYRIDRVELGVSQVVEAVRIEPETFRPVEIEEDGVAMSAFVAPAPVFPLFLDLPLMTGEEVPHAPHLAITGDPWPGSVAVYSSGSDADYTLNRLVVPRATIGVTHTDLLAGPPGVIDRGDGLVVELTSGALESIDEAALLNGGNLAAIGDGTPGAWELFQFRDAALVGENTYLLSHRLRGQQGSDAWMPEVWPEGSYFVLLNGVPEQISLSVAQRNIARHYRIGPAQRGYDDPSYVHEILAFEGIGLKPLSPVHLASEIDGAGNLTLRWVRRTRIGGDSWDGTDVPLGEESESYIVRVVKSGAVLREEQVSAPEWSYAQSEQLGDGATGAVELHVAQVSALFGAGAYGVRALTL